MRSTTESALKLLALVAVAGALPAVFAHGGSEGTMDMDTDMDMSQEESKPDPDSYAPTYFSHPEHVVEIYAHIALMVISWVIMLPLGKKAAPARLIAFWDESNPCSQLSCFPLRDHDIRLRSSFYSTS